MGRCPRLPAAAGSKAACGSRSERSTCENAPTRFGWWRARQRVGTSTRGADDLPLVENYTCAVRGPPQIRHSVPIRIAHAARLSIAGGEQLALIIAAVAKAVKEICLEIPTFVVIAHRRYSA